MSSTQSTWVNVRFRAKLTAVFLVLQSILLVTPALSDRLYFTDGESITGVLVGIDDGKVNWQSAMLGELSVDQHNIDYIESGDHFDLKLTGENLHNCWSGGITATIPTPLAPRYFMWSMRPWPAWCLWMTCRQNCTVGLWRRVISGSSDWITRC